MVSVLGRIEGFAEVVRMEDVRRIRERVRVEMIGRSFFMRECLLSFMYLVYWID